MVGLERFELSASATRKQRSTRLSHSPTKERPLSRCRALVQPKSPAWPVCMARLFPDVCGMGVQIRRSAERGFADHGWLVARHSFSFADYHDPAHMGFRSLRVINQDVVAPAMGFPPHGHRDMEIFTYVLEGVIEHRDSLGNHAQLRPGRSRS